MRRERVVAQDPWSFHEQVLTVAHEPVEVKNTRANNGQIRTMYPCGADGPNSAIVEKWAVLYPAVPSSGCVPLEQRAVPSVRRAVFFRRPSIRIIANIEVDPEERLLHLLRFDQLSVDSDRS